MWRGLWTAIALVAVEYVLISATIEVRDLSFLSVAPWLPEQMKRIGPFVACVAAGFVVIGGSGLREAFALATPAPVYRRGALFYAHLALFLMFFVLTAAFAQGRVEASHLGVAGWVGLALATGGTALSLAIPQSAFRWAFTTGARISLAGIAVGALSLLAGLAADAAWEHLARASLWASSSLLRMLGWSVLVELDPPSIRVGYFLAEIRPACSGVEGMGLMLVLVGTYLFAFRRELRFPLALLLLPLSVGFAFAANAVRIAALMVVGSEISVKIADGGFHSKAGWVVFCLAAIGLIFGSRRFLRRDPEEAIAPSEAARAEARPFVIGELSPYIVPELSILGTALLTGLWATNIDRLMGLRFVAGALALWLVTRARLPRLRVRGLAVSVGIAVYALWIVLVKHDVHDPVYAAFLSSHGAVEIALFLSARVLGSVLVVPIAEELAFRGFLARWPSGADFEAVRPAAISLQGLAVSSLVFGLLHSDVVAAVAAGLAYGLLYRKTEDLADPIVAHAVTNGLIAVEVLALGHWGRW